MQEIAALLRSVYGTAQGARGGGELIEVRNAMQERFSDEWSRSGEAP
jgi:hypothetical protein